MAKKSKTGKKTETREPTSTEAPNPGKKSGSHGDKKILSIAIEPALHARLALLARAEGRSVTDLVVEAVSKNLTARINSALDALRAQADLDK